MASAQEQTFSTGVNRAIQLTKKGFIDKKSVFSPTALDSLLQTDEYVMLIASFEGCMPCEWLRTSDVFDQYPISPFYIDFRLNATNETIPHTMLVSGFPTCFFFNKSGEVVAVTKGTAKYYEKLDRIIKDKERVCEATIQGLDSEQSLSFYNYSYKANAAYLKGDMDTMFEQALKSMELLPTVYNRYLLYTYYLNKNDVEMADKYRKLALENVSKRDEFIFGKLLEKLREE